MVGLDSLLVHQLWIVTTMVCRMNGEKNRTLILVIVLITLQTLMVMAIRTLKNA